MQKIYCASVNTLDTTTGLVNTTMTKFFANPNEAMKFIKETMRRLSPDWTCYTGGDYFTHTDEVCGIEYQANVYEDMLYNNVEEEKQHYEELMQASIQQLRNELPKLNNV